MYRKRIDFDTLFFPWWYLYYYKYHQGNDLRKKAKRISFYMTESEYEKLEMSSSKFGIGVNALAKQGSTA